MVDKELKPWLIEVNTNPCIEESSALLKQLIPRMLDDAFKLTLDVVYGQISNFKKANNDNDDNIADELASEKKIYSVDGYNDEQNMWGNYFY